MESLRNDAAAQAALAAIEHRILARRDGTSRTIQCRTPVLIAALDDRAFQIALSIASLDHAFGRGVLGVARIDPVHLLHIEGIRYQQGMTLVLDDDESVARIDFVRHIPGGRGSAGAA